MGELLAQGNALKNALLGDPMEAQRLLGSWEDESIRNLNLIENDDRVKS